MRHLQKHDCSKCVKVDCPLRKLERQISVRLEFPFKPNNRLEFNLFLQPPLQPS
jgi:hypothetical protein